MAGVFPAVDAAERGAEQGARGRVAVESMPLVFELNRGQTDPRVKFVSRGSGYAVFLTPDEMVLGLAAPDTMRAGVLRVKLVGANRAPHIVGREELPGTANYFLGNDPAQWRAGVPTYAKVAYESVYPGIDLVYYGKGRTIEYDFVVAPGADPEAVTLGVEGAGRLVLDAAGDLVLQMADGDLRMSKPLIYQLVDGVRMPIAGHYVLKSGNRVGFRLATYDASKALVIDPVLVYSTFLGGSGTDEGLAVAADGAGNVYVTGSTQSSNFPLQGALSTSLSGNTDAFVTKFNGDGTVAFSTYFGGGSPDQGRGIALDGSGNIYLTGQTQSANFPTSANAYTALSGGSADAFVTKLDPAGNAIIYSTFLGGKNVEQGNAIAVFGNRIYVTGSTTSGGPQNPFPTTPGAFDTTYNGKKDSDAFVSVLDPDAAGSAQLVYSTFLGSSSNDSGNGIAVDGSGNYYVTGATGTSAFVTKFSAANAHQYTVNQAGAGNAIAVGASGVYVAGSSGTNAFVAKYPIAGGASLFVSNLAGAAGKGIALDSSGNAYVTGSITGSAVPATPGAFQTAGGGGQDAFVAMYSSAGTLSYFSYLGGSGNEAGNGIAAKASGGRVYVTGTTASNNFPVSAAFDPDCGNPAGSCSSSLTDAFVTVLNVDLTPPAVTLTAPANGVFTNNTTALAFSGAAGTASGDLPLVTVKIYSGTGVSGAPIQTLTADGSSGAYTVNAALGAGTYTAQAQQSDEAGNTGFSSANTFVVDTTAPGVTINQAAAQPDPTNVSPINFTVVFSEPVTGFAASDVTIGGTAGGTKTVVVSGGPSTYNVAVSGMTTTGMVSATIAAGTATDLAGNPSLASTSSDNIVVWDVSAPTVSLTAPFGTVTNANPINFTATFSEPVTGFTASDVTIGGTAGGTKTVVVSGGPTVYTVAVGGMTSDGTVIATIVAGAASDLAGNSSLASNSVTVNWDATPPVFGAVSNLMFQTGTTVIYETPVAIDPPGTPVAVSCSPPSGTEAGVAPFPLGAGMTSQDTTVTCTATDVAGNTSSIAFIVTVQTTAPPTLGLNVTDVTVAQGAPITLTATINVAQSTTTIAPDCVNTAWTIRRLADGSVVAPRVRERVYGIPNDLATLLPGTPTVVACDVSDAIDPALLPPGLYRFFATYSNYIVDTNTEDPPFYDVWTGSINSGEANLTIEGTGMRVGVDIKPGINSTWGCNSQGQGHNIAILSGEIFDPAAPAPEFRRQFDPIAEVDVASVRFGKTGTENAALGSATPTDVNGDGVLDLILKFSIQESGLTCAEIPTGQQSADVIGIVKGMTTGGAPFSGADTFRMVTGQGNE